MHEWHADRVRASAPQAYGWHADRDRRPRRGLDRPRVLGGRGRRPAHPDRGAHEKGHGVSFLADKEGWHGKAVPADQEEAAIAELGGTAVASASRRRAAEAFKPTVPFGELHPSAAARLRRGHRDAQGVRRGARVAGRPSPRPRGARRRGGQLHPHRGLRGRRSRAVHRAVHRRAEHGGRADRPAGAGQDGVRRRRSAPSSRAPPTSCAWAPSAAPTCASAARTPACRSARTGRRRWRWRTCRCSARSNGSTVLYPADGNATVKLVARDVRPAAASPTCAPRARPRRRSTAPTRTFPVGGSQDAARTATTTSPTHRGRRRHGARVR